MIKRHVFIITIYIYLFTNLIYAQQSTFFRTYGESTGNLNSLAIKKTADNCFVSLTSCESGGILIKSDSSGNLVWSRRYQMNPDDYLIDLEVMRDSNIVLLGTLSVSGLVEYLLIKIDLAGDTIWKKRIDFGWDVMPKCIKRTRDNGLIISGLNYIQGNINSGISATKLDSIGNIEWSYIYTGMPGVETRFIEAIDSGYIGVWGASFNQLGGIIKISNNGTFSWYKRFYFSNHSFSMFEVENHSDGYLLFGIGDRMIANILVIIKTDFSGNILWNKEYQYNDDFRFSNGNRTNDSSYVFLMRSANSNNNLTKVDISGNIVWSKYLSFNATDIIEDNDKGLVILGNIPAVDSLSYSRIGILKTDSLLHSNQCSSYDTSISPINLTLMSFDEILSQSSYGILKTGYFNVLFPNLTVDTNCISNSVGMEEISDNAQLNIYPNPSTGNFNIFFNQSVNYSGLSIINIYGQEIFSKQIFRNEESISINENITPGIYIIILKAKSQILSKKLLIK